MINVHPSIPNAKMGKEDKAALNMVKFRAPAVVDESIDSFRDPQEVIRQSR